MPHLEQVVAYQLQATHYGTVGKEASTYSTLTMAYHLICHNLKCLAVKVTNSHFLKEAQEAVAVRHCLTMTLLKKI